MKIFLNPGHGGSDPGACANGLREREVVRDIADMTAYCLSVVAYDVKVFQFDDLQEICDAANDWGADLFVSIHCNAGGGTGTETYHCRDSTAGARLAHCLHRQLLASLPLFDRGIKHKDFFVLKYTACPAALVETAFIDNPRDANLLARRAEDFARAIARAITDF